jgi:hypothetical protein
MTPERRHDLYWLGYRHGKRLAVHEPHIDHLPALRLGLILSGTRGRPFALGELRGYRVTSGLPEPLMGHKVLR